MGTVLGAWVLKQMRWTRNTLDLAASEIERLQHIVEAFRTVLFHALLSETEQ